MKCPKLLCLVLRFGVQLAPGRGWLRVLRKGTMAKVL
jgi:hypothetical protein